MDYLVWGAMLEAYRKLTYKAEDNRWTQASASGYLGQPVTGPIDKVVKDFSNKATGGWCCCLELVVNTSNICFDNGILAFDH